jgi:hypothetical protein
MRCVPDWKVHKFAAIDLHPEPLESDVKRNLIPHEPEISDCRRYHACRLSIRLGRSPGTYQVTGPVLELTDSKIVVQKDNERWILNRTPDTKVMGDLKVGGKVTITYTMTAKSVTVK